MLSFVKVFELWKYFLIKKWNVIDTCLLKTCTILFSYKSFSLFFCIIKQTQSISLLIINMSTTFIIFNLFFIQSEKCHLIKFLKSPPYLISKSEYLLSVSWWKSVNRASFSFPYLKQGVFSLCTQDKVSLLSVTPHHEWRGWHPV